MTVAPEAYISRTLAVFNWWTLMAAAVERCPEVDLPAVAAEADRVLLSSEPFHSSSGSSGRWRRSSATPVSLIHGEMTSCKGTRAIAGLGYLAEYTAPPASSCSVAPARSSARPTWTR